MTKVFVAGGNGMVGNSVLRLQPDLAPDWDVKAPSRHELNLLDKADVDNYFKAHQFDFVINCAARVGGIKANMENQAAFLAENILIGTHLIDGARQAGVPKLLNLGSSCMYPRDYQNPLIEEYVLAAPLEPTNEGYAISKIAAERLCRYISDQFNMTYRTFIPCNLYGPGDNYDPLSSHMVSAAILKVHNAIETDAETVEIWGDGTVRREFIYVEDLAKFMIESYEKLDDMPPCLNVGLDKDYTINECYEKIAEVLGYKGKFTHDLSKPAGMRFKLMDSSKAKQFGWNPDTPLKEGIRIAYEHFLNHQK